MDRRGNHARSRSGKIAARDATDAEDGADERERARDDEVERDVGEDDDGEDEDVDAGGGGKRARRAREGAGEGGADDEDEGELRRRTVVEVSGNGRTKECWLGKRGVVRKAMGVGGWYVIQTSDDGQRVKLRRSALTVVEPPSDDAVPENEDGDDDDVEDDVENGEEEGDDEDEGEEEEDEGDEDDEDDDSKDNMKTRLRRPTRIPGNGPPSQAAAAAMKRLQERRRSARPNCMSNFERLTLTTLLKYKKVYGLEPNPETDSDKNAVAHEIGRHFLAQKIDEQKVLQEFMCAVADTTQIAR